MALIIDDCSPLPFEQSGVSVLQQLFSFSIFGMTALEYALVPSPFRCTNSARLGYLQDAALPSYLAALALPLGNYFLAYPPGLNHNHFRMDYEPRRFSEAG